MWRDTIDLLFLTVGVPWSMASEVSRRLKTGTGTRRHTSREKRLVPCTIVQELYNSLMGAVDATIRDAHRTYVNNIRCNRIWKVIFFQCFNTWIYTAFCLQHWDSYEEPTHGKTQFRTDPAKNFRLALIDDLAKEAREERAIRRSVRSRQRALATACLPVGTNIKEFLIDHELAHRRDMWGNKPRGECKHCRRCNKGQKHVTTTSWICRGCKVYLCPGTCYTQHHLIKMQSETDSSQPHT